MKTYPKLKETSIPWLGKIPEHWEVKPLFTVLKEKKIRNSGNRINNLLSLSYGQIITKDITSNEGLLPESFETYQIVEEKNIILRLTDLQNDQRSLRVGQVRCKTGIITSAYVCLEGYGIDKDYAFCTLFAFDLQKVFYGLGNGVRQSMGFEDLKRLPFPLPPPAEQQAIAAYLDKATVKIDALIAEQEKLCTLLAEKRKALISHVVTKGLDSKVKLKDSGISWIGKIPEHWEIKKVKHLFNNLDGRRKPISVENREYSSVEYDYYGASGIIDKIDSFIFDNETLLLVSEDGANLVMRNLPIVYIASGRYWVNNHAHILSPLPSANMMYMFYLIESSDIFPFVTGSAQPKLSQENLCNISLTHPPLPEQQAIAAYLDKATAKLDALAAKAEEAIALLKERRSALISEVVTGKVKVS